MTKPKGSPIFDEMSDVPSWPLDMQLAYWKERAEVFEGELDYYRHHRQGSDRIDELLRKSVDLMDPDMVGGWAMDVGIKYAEMEWELSQNIKGWQSMVEIHREQVLALEERIDGLRARNKKLELDLTLAHTRRDDAESQGRHRQGGRGAVMKRRDRL